MHNSFCKRTYIDWFNYTRHHISEYLYYPKDIQVVEWQVFIQCCMYWRALCFRKRQRVGGRCTSKVVSTIAFERTCIVWYNHRKNKILQMSASPAKNKISHQTNVLKKEKKKCPISRKKVPSIPKTGPYLFCSVFFLSLLSFFGLFLQK